MGTFESTWFILNSGPGDPAENMACDEALLETSPVHKQPVLRFYDWKTPAATFGYFQRFADVADLTHLRPLIRRPTGGGLVLHDGDWTYSVAIPPSNAWFELKAVDSYCRVHEWIQSAFQKLGVTTVLSPCCVQEGPGQCFVGAEQFDLLHEGVKIAGAAQRRRKDGLLIQGSIQPARTGLPRTSFERAFCEAAVDQWKVHWEEFHPSQSFQEQVQRLRSEKYSQVDYNERR